LTSSERGKFFRKRIDLFIKKRANFTWSRFHRATISVSSGGHVFIDRAFRPAEAAEKRNFDKTQKFPDLGSRIEMIREYGDVLVIILANNLIEKTKNELAGRNYPF